MGKKSRAKKERKLASAAIDPAAFLRQISSSQERNTTRKGAAELFSEQLKATRTLFHQYSRIDVALALSVSELWPANTASPVKHIFAWRVLLELQEDSVSAKAIVSYADFKDFTEALYAVWPEFPMLEDFLPEADWGQVKARLGRHFVPMFYGSCIERTPDFVEAFRITYAHAPEALAYMDLVIALQSQIIHSYPHQLGATETETGHIEIVPETFWLACEPMLNELGRDLAKWRAKAGTFLDAALGGFTTPLTWDSFGNSVMEGSALPFLALDAQDVWFPMSVRNAPGVLIDHWARSSTGNVSVQAHRKLALFVAERFVETVMGPLTLLVDGKVCKDLPVSCIVSDDSGVYLVCACDHASVERLAATAADVYAKVRRRASLSFRFAGEQGAELSQNGPDLTADKLHIILVPTLKGTGFGMIDLPKPPTRLIPLADFISIFDSLRDLDDLHHYWRYVDDQARTVGPFSRGSVDLFASYRDTHGVLVDGAIAPNFIGLDPHWGTSWRFIVLSDFWSQAPAIFPDGSSGWQLFSQTTGVTGLHSRHHHVAAYSTSIGASTFQAMLEVPGGMSREEARIIDLFAQLLVDCGYRCGELLPDVALFQQPHILFSCTPDAFGAVEMIEVPRPLGEFASVVTSLVADDSHPGLFHLKIDIAAVLAGLNGAVDGTFEVRCLLEVLEKCHAAMGLRLPDALEQRVAPRAMQAARYQLNVVVRRVDVPDHVVPIGPSLSDYKRARKQLAKEIQSLGLVPGRYELSEAKTRIDPAGASLRSHLERRLASLDRHQLIQACVEQHDAHLVAERQKIERARQSLSHAVDYDRLDAIEEARKDFGVMARHYRYLLEKTLSSPMTGDGEVTKEALQELIGLVDWLMVLTGASNVLHNGIDVGGVEIDDAYIPTVFYSQGSDDRETTFAREYARIRLGQGANKQDAVEGESEELLSSEPLKRAFIADVGFDLDTLIVALTVLSQAQRHGFASELSLSYTATPSHVAQGLVDSIDDLDLVDAEKIVAFLTLSDSGIRRLAEKDVDEGDVPYWEHNKRIHRYTIRPLVRDGENLRWGAETASRAMNLWMSTVRDGYLPADFGWQHVEPVIRGVKESIEKRLEHRTEEIFLRHTPYVWRGIDFFKRFRKEGFEDVGDFDVLAYWPETNVIATVECKYNQPPFTVKDGRRLRDRIFGKAEDDKAGQFSRILRRRQFLEKHRSRMLELLEWPQSSVEVCEDVELYVSRDLYYWMVHTPYPVSTRFVQVDTLDTWIKTELLGVGQPDVEEATGRKTGSS